MNETVVAGVDGSAESVAAARYAAAMAERRRVPLTLVNGYLDPMGYSSLGVFAFPAALPDPRAEADELVRKAAAAVRADFPDLEVRSRLLPSSGPVVVYRPVGTSDQDAAVVVGVDGSPGAEPALAFGFAEAAERRVALHAIHVYVPTGDGSAMRAEGLLNAALSRWAAAYPDVEVRREIRAVAPHEPGVRHHVTPAGSAEAVLVDASRRAALVVVGSRGRGGFTGLLLGSVSQALLHQAHGPVAVAHTRPAN